MKTLQDKVAIVTGASKGIGAGIAKELAVAGASVVVNYASSKEGADRVVAEITGQGGRAVAVQGDVAKAGDIKRLFEETKKAFGALDVLVNNAGVFKFEPIEAVTEAEFHRQFNTNVLGTYLSVQESLKYFGPDGGSIVNVSSVVGSNPLPMGVLYSATKGAVENMTRGLALELAPRRIRVNAVSPGATESEGAIASGFFDGEAGAQVIAGTPLGRLGKPGDIAPVVLFLASDASGWITGESIRVSGGLR